MSVIMGTVSSFVHMKCTAEWSRKILSWSIVAASLVYLFVFSGNAQSVESRGASAVFWMIGRWNGSGGDLSHCWMIPIASAYVIWRRRKSIVEAPRSPAVWATLGVAACFFLHWIGFRVQLTRLSLLALVGLTWFIPLTLYGFAFSRYLIFPCSYLIFCIPLSFLNGITVPLRSFMSMVTTGLLNGLGIAAVRSGTAIESMAAGGFRFDVADPCSGLRSLLALTAVTALYAALTQRTFWTQWALFLCAIPIAICGNIARILSIALVAQAFGQDVAIDYYHDYSGYVVFIVAILVLIAIGRFVSTGLPHLLDRWRPTS